MTDILPNFLVQHFPCDSLIIEPLAMTARPKRMCDIADTLSCSAFVLTSSTPRHEGLGYVRGTSVFAVSGLKAGRNEMAARASKKGHSSRAFDRRGQHWEAAGEWKVEDRGNHNWGDGDKDDNKLEKIRDNKTCKQSPN